MFYIIGVAHRAQAKQKRNEDTEEQKHFRKCLAEAIERFKPALIAEEFSEWTLQQLLKDKKAEHESLTKAIADSVKVGHRFCDPDDKARAKMQYVEGTTLGLQIFMRNDENLSNDECSDRGFAIEIARYWPLRERYWLDQLGDVKDKDVVFVCGDAHVESFRELLNRDGINSTIVARHIGVTSSDDAFWDRVKRYLASHPELHS
jgi:hypothetical protein